MNVGHDVSLTDTESLGSRMPHSGAPSSPRGAKRMPPLGRMASAVRVGPDPQKPRFEFDGWSLVRPALRRWPWVFFGAAAGGAASFFAASWMWQMTFSSTAQLVRYDPPISENEFQPHPVDVTTLIGRMEDPAFLRRVGNDMNPKLTSAQVLSHMRVKPERNSKIMNVIASGSDAGETTDLANAFARETVRFTQEIQREEAADAGQYVSGDLAEAERQLSDARRNMPTLAPDGASDPGVESAVTDGERYRKRIQSARDKLAQLLATYTDAHPLVRQQRAFIAALEAEAATGIDARTAASHAGNVAAHQGRTVSRDEFDIALFRVRQLESLRMQLLYRRQQIELFRADPPGGFRITMPASGDTLAVHRPWLKVGLLSILGCVLGIAFTVGDVLVGEFIDGRVKTVEDVIRVTSLPVIATLGDLRQMSIGERDDWAFRTWIALQSRLSHSPNHGLICGITSSGTGEGRSTWIGLLAGAARKCGFRVLTIGTKRTADGAVDAHDPPETVAAAPGARQGSDAVSAPAGAPAASKPPNGSAAHGGAVVPRGAPEPDSIRGVGADSDFTALTATALFTPAQVTEKLMGSETDPLVHIPLPGWSWNLERRKQWQGALEVWRKIENVVILVELPPASVAEAVLLASNLPNILWLAESGKSQAADTRRQLQTLRQARCSLVGAVVNRALNTFAAGRLSRWMSCVMFLAALGMTGVRLGAQPTAEDAQSGTFSVVGPSQRADWQEQLTLGPGDTLTLSIYGDPDSTLKAVPVGPDGRISYLEAHDIVAAGLTVDELRDRMDRALADFRRAPQVIIVPVSITSKKYYVLGKVADRGVFTLDRPTTLLEAIARAHGIETGMSSDRTMIDLADLSHSFVARGGRKLPVDFERLFEHGDLSQNVAIEPGDYIYLPAAELKRVYILGAVTRPGAYTYTSSTGALGAVSASGGFADDAWKARVLVLRGSLNHPQLFTIDAADVLSGKKPDTPLEPHDIVFVAKRPWYRPEQLLDEAASAFVTSAVVTWTGIHVDTRLHR